MMVDTQRVGSIPQLGEELCQLAVAPVDVADDVERPVQIRAVAPSAFAGDGGRGDLLFAPQHEHPPKALALQPPDRATEQRALAAHHVRAELAIGARAIALHADVLGDVQHDRDGKDVVVSGRRTSGARASGCTLVASTTVSRPPRSRTPAMKWRTSKASFVTDWSFASSPTKLRQKSEESTSVGEK
jgi:hypothetical protein